MKKAADTKVVTQMGNQRHSQDDQRRVVDYIQGGAIGDVAEVHVWTNRPYGFWPQGIPALHRLRNPHDRAGTTGRSISVSRLRWRATTPFRVRLAWDLFLGVAPEVPYHPIYHPFNWRGWVDWGQSARSATWART